MKGAEETGQADGLLITGAWVMASEGWLDPGWVTVRGGQVTALGAGEPDAVLAASARQHIRAEGKALLPGLVNGHTHLSQTLMRGLAGGRPLLRWLKELIWPLQAAMSAEELHLAALLGLVENLRCGVTEVVDHQKINHTRAHTTSAARAVETVGLRCTLARAWADRGSGAESPAALLDELQSWFETFTGHPLVQVASGPLTPWRCSGETLQKTHALAACCGGRTHIHVSETQDEVRMTAEETGLPPVIWLDSLGVLDRNTDVVHAVWVNASEMDLLAARGARVVHCPVSNAVLGSGIAPVAGLLERGVPLRFGTDGPASNDTQDLFETAKMGLGLARAGALNAALLPPNQALRMMTGGRVVTAGMPADLVLVNLRHARAMPVQDIDSALVLCCHGADVETVLVGGRLLLHEGRVLSLDEEALFNDCQAAVHRLRQRAGIA